MNPSRLLAALLVPCALVLLAGPAAANEGTQDGEPVYCVYTGAVYVLGIKVWDGIEVCVPGP